MSVLFKLCIFFKVLINLLLFFWCNLIEGLFKIYSILVNCELICVVKWICCVFFLDKVFDEWFKVKYFKLILFKNDNFEIIFFKIWFVIDLFWLFNFKFLK